MENNLKQIAQKIHEASLNLSTLDITELNIMYGQHYLASDKIVKAFQSELFASTLSIFQMDDLQKWNALPLYMDKKNSILSVLTSPFFSDENKLREIHVQTDVQQLCVYYTHDTMMELIFSSLF